MIGAQKDVARLHIAGNDSSIVRIIQREGNATRNPGGLQLPASPYQVMAGTVIPAALVTGINSDLPGQGLANVTDAVDDTATGR